MFPSIGGGLPEINRRGTANAFDMEELDALEKDNFNKEEW